MATYRNSIYVVSKIELIHDANNYVVSLELLNSRRASSQPVAARFPRVDESVIDVCGRFIFPVIVNYSKTTTRNVSAS